MLHIKKTGTQFEAEGKKHTKDFIDSCWNDANHKYENLIYDSSRLENLGSVLFEEQKDCIELIKIKEIMHELQKTTDVAEQVGKILKNLIIKYA